MYTVKFTPAALRQFASLAPDVRTRVDAALLRLSQNPRMAGVSKLKNVEGYRLRVGEFRVLFEVRDDILLVLVFRVAHRREAYRP